MTTFRAFALSLLMIGLVAGCGGSVPEHPSRVPLSGALNFRDVGGYQTIDGKHVKHGRLFRSDDLANLNTADIEQLESLGIRTVLDLRHDYERAKYPNRLPGGDHIRIVEISVYYPPLDRRESQRKILSGELERGHFRQLMIEANRAFALEFRDQFAGLVRIIAASDTLPIVVHCADGKDRTGLAIAILLSAVGVPRETVYQDYLLSNLFLENKNKRNAFMASLGSMFSIPASEIRYLVDVRREYLEAAFAAIDERYGSFDAYLRDGLGLDEPTLERLRLALTE